MPHILETASNAEAAGHALEGATKADAVLIAPKTGFAVLFEAKVLADASGGIGFDLLRNQIARSIDAMLEPNPNLQERLTRRRPGQNVLRAHYARNRARPPREPPVRLPDDVLA